MPRLPAVTLEEGLGMLAKRWSIAVPLIVGLIVGACGAEADRSALPTVASPEPSSSASAIVGSASPAAGSPAPTTAVASLSPAPAKTPRPTARPAPTPIAWTDNEEFLKQSLRDDARLACTPRRSNLPPRAIAGIECRSKVAFVERVGAYLFPTTDTMLQTYQERMDEYEVLFDAGSCAAGLPSDTSWASSFAPDEESKPWARTGCYFDENGVANLRITCDNAIYVGVLGGNKDMARLFDWAMRTGETRSYQGSGIAPGICEGGFEVY